MGRKRKDHFSGRNECLLTFAPAARSIQNLMVVFGFGISQSRAAKKRVCHGTLLNSFQRVQGLGIIYITERPDGTYGRFYAHCHERAANSPDPDIDSWFLGSEYQDFYGHD